MFFRGSRALFLTRVSVSQQEVENFKKLNVISKDEFDTLTPKAPVDPKQEVPPPPMPGGFAAFCVFFLTRRSTPLPSL